MKTRIPAAMAAVLFAAANLTLPVSVSAAESGLLDAAQFRIMDENLVYIGADYLNPASVLFDDQDKVPASFDNTKVDSALWEATTRNVNWKPNWQSEFGDDTCLIDLGANYVITGICFLDTNGVQDWAVYDSGPFDWVPLASFTTDSYNTWRGVQVEQPRATRYLRFVTPCGDSGVSELAIYGYLSSELTAEQKARDAAKATATPKMDLTAGQRIGFNAFIDDPMTAIMAAGNVREYHNLSWMLDDSGKVKFTQGTWGDMDSYYAAMQAQNISIIPCIQGASKVISGENAAEIPVPAGADTTDPASYAKHAEVLYQIAARYGSNKDVPLSSLNITDAQEAKVGMGLLGAVENCNEPNKTWSGNANFFTPYELAAMCSADYDGHEGTLKNAGVKQADPGFRLAMGGMLNTASLIDYLTQMKLWFDWNRRDGVFAVDIINVHLGPDDYNPEDSGMAASIRRLLDWMDKNAPGTELWISEFEIPMADCETEGTDNHDNEKYQLRYAQRVARTYLTAIGAGADRMTKFQLRDEGEGVYYNSGLVTGKGEWNKKLAWYYTACMTSVLANADLTAAETAGGVCKYTFTDRTNGDVIYCLWSPTNEDKVIKGYNLPMPMNGNAYLTTMGEYAEGTVTALASGMRSIAVDVSETPVFVTVSAEKKPIVNGKGKYITPELLSLDADFSGETCDLSAAPADTKLSQFYRMFDEPDTMPEFVYGDTGALTAPKTDVTGSGLTCYVQLDQPYVLDGFGVYDTFGTGSIEVYDAHTDALLWSSDLGSYMSRSISLTEESAPTDLLKIVKGGGAMNELALYGYPSPAWKLHDVNGDGAENLADAVALQRYLLCETAVLKNPAAADCDGSGRLNAADLTLLKRILMQ